MAAIDEESGENARETTQAAVSRCSISYRGPPLGSPGGSPSSNRNLVPGTKPGAVNNSAHRKAGKKCQPYAAGAADAASADGNDGRVSALNVLWSGRDEQPTATPTATPTTVPTKLPTTTRPVRLPDPGPERRRPSRERSPPRRGRLPDEADKLRAEGPAERGRRPKGGDGRPDRAGRAYTRYEKLSETPDGKPDGKPDGRPSERPDMPGQPNERAYEPPNKPNVRNKRQNKRNERRNNRPNERGMTLVVRGVPHHATCRDIETFFGRKRAGVDRVSLVRDRDTPRAYIAYVDLAAPRFVPAAVSLSGEMLLAHRVTITTADTDRLVKRSAWRRGAGAEYRANSQPEGPETLVIANLDFHVSDEALSDALAAIECPMRAVVERESSGRSRGTALVVLEPGQDVEQTAQAISHLLLGPNNRPLTVTRTGSAWAQYPSRRQLMQKLTRALPPVPRPLPTPSQYVVLRNMFEPEEQSGKQWIHELEEDVRSECQDSYGPVLHLAVDASPPGETHIKFSSTDAAARALKGFNGRFFSGRTVAASSINECLYLLKYPESAAKRALSI